MADNGDARVGEGIPYQLIADALQEGTVVPFLGAGASAAHRPAGASWSPGEYFCPRGDELAKHLANLSVFPDEEGTDDLMLVSSYFQAKPADRPTLRKELDKIFCADSLRPGPIHELLADCPNLPLIMTTNYDDLIERTIQKAKNDPQRKAENAPNVIVDHGEEKWKNARLANDQIFSSR